METDIVRSIIDAYTGKFRRKKEIVDYFTKFHMNGPLRNHARNLEANNIALTLGRALDEEYDVTQKLKDEIRERALEDEQNITIKIEGPTGEAKSEGGQTLTFWWREPICEKQGLSITEETLMEGILLAFNTGEMAESLDRLQPGFVTLQDERPHGSGAEKINTAHDVENVNSQDRAMQVAHVYCDPKHVKLAVYDYTLVVMGKDKNERENRFIVYDDHDRLLGHVILPMHSYENFRRMYRERKSGNITTTWKNRGKFTARSLTSADDTIIAELVAYAGELCKGGVKPTKIALLTKLAEIGTPGSVRKHGLLATKAFTEYQMGAGRNTGRNTTKDTSEAIQPAEDFAMFFEKNAPCGDVERRIIADYLRGLSERDLMNEHHATRHQVRVAKERGRDSIIGYVFEWFCAVLVGVPLDQVRALCASNEHKPDLIWQGIIYQFKWRDNTDPKANWSMRKDAWEEYDEAVKQEKPFTFIETNRAWGPGIREVKLHPKTDPDAFFTHQDMTPWATTGIPLTKRVLA